MLLQICSELILPKFFIKRETDKFDQQSEQI